jgi:hypothetical protein
MGILHWQEVSPAIKTEMLERAAITERTAYEYEDEVVVRAPVDVIITRKRVLDS